MRNRARQDDGSMAIEIVVLVPVLVMLMMLVVAFGRHVSAEGDAQAAAREAVREATLARSQPEAVLAAQAGAAASVPAGLTCDPAVLEGAFVAGGTISATVTCTVSWADLGMIGLTGSTTVHATASAPLDLYRRTGAP